MTAIPMKLASEGLFPQKTGHEPSVVALAIAILIQAVRDAIGPRRRSEKDWEIWKLDALEWFSSEEDHPGSLVWVCEVTSIPPKSLRFWFEQVRKLDPESQKEIIQTLTRLAYARNGPHPRRGRAQKAG
jgi:hypothetical protein